jgi:hypothetical protein
MSRGWLALTVLALAAAGAAPTAAAVVKASFGVSVVVMASCRIIAGQANPCAPSQGKASALIAEKPVVHFSRDPNTGLVTQTIEF